MIRALRAAGIQPLVNSSVHLQEPGLDLWLAGVDDLWEGRPDLRSALADAPDGSPLVLLAHNPDQWLDAGAKRADLTLSGHVHGGQVRLPVLGALHTQGTHLDRQRADGWFCDGLSHLFVSRGLGESLPFRMGALPQATLIHLQPER
jgi:predicted MPP superfamily phosphohydrolase